MKNKSIIKLLSQYIIVISILLYTATVNAQDLTGGRISGNFQLEAQTYNPDEIIGVPDVPEKMLSNSFMNLMYSTSNIEVGLRYEGYFGPMIGYSQDLEGDGIAYRYGRYHNDLIDITAGNFYEQFGSGMIFRSYQEWTLGYDNSIDGMRVKLAPTEGIDVTGIIGKQRQFWTKYPGLVRGGDINFNINRLFLEGSESYNLDFGASVISKYQQDKSPTLKLPENTLAYALRANFANNFMSLEGEYAHKYNDPIMSGSYFGLDGISMGINYHWIDNMDFRSNRTVTGQNPALNYIPPLPKNQAYRLCTTYPFGTQMNGETGLQANITYSLPRKSTLGGKYGTTIDLNYSRVHNLDTSKVDEYTYDSKFLGMGDELLYQDINLDITRKFTKKFKMNFVYMYLNYNKDYCEFEGKEYYGMITSNVLVFNGTYKLPKRHAIRLELQHAWTSQEVDILENKDNLNGNWVMASLEYTLPNFFISISDEYNYGNQFEERKLHYYNIGAGWTHEATRVQLSYTRQRDGILCVGGVCRYVPATDGLYMSVSSSF